MINFLLFEDHDLGANCSLLCFYLPEYNMNGYSTANKGLSEIEMKSSLGHSVEIPRGT